MTKTVAEYYATNYTFCTNIDHSFLASWKGVAYPVHTIGVIALPFQLFTFYCILEKTPKTMESVKWPLFNSHFWFFVLDLNTCAFMTPYFFYPAIGGFTVGILNIFHVSIPVQVGVGATMMIGALISVVHLFEHRSSFIENNKFRITRTFTKVTLYLFDYLFWAVVWYPLLVGIAAKDQEVLKLESLIREPCPTEEFFTPAGFIFFADQFWTLIVSIHMFFGFSLFSVQIALFSGCCIYYLFISPNILVSAQTRQLQKQFFIGLTLQTSIPYVFLGLPAFIPYIAALANSATQVMFTIQNQRMSNVLIIKYCLAVLLLYSILCFVAKYIVENGPTSENLFRSLKEFISDILIDYPENTDAFIINSYYYPKSKSLGENAVAIILLMDRNTNRLSNYQLTLIGTNETNSVVAKAKLMKKEIFSGCSYVSIVAKTHLLPGLTMLHIANENSKLEIPFRYPRKVSEPVIMCITPQFLSEQWQMFVTQAHVVKTFGGHMHMYVTSMVGSYFELVKEYERQGYLTIDYWVRPKFPSSLDALEPNANSEFRNQAGAYTDCLLQYKESATFITFLDLDDVLFPRGFHTYYDEFAFLSFTNPSIKTFIYDRRNYMIYRESHLENVNFEEAFGHSWYNPELVTAGKVMARPANLDSMWIHASYNTRENEKLHVKHNFAYHLKRLKERDSSELAIMDMELVEMKNIQNDKNVLASIQNDFHRMMNLTKIQTIAKTLQKENFYLPVMMQCYIDQHYEKSIFEKFETCSNSEGCEIPQREDLKCIHSEAEYISGPKMTPVTFHYHINPWFSYNVNCTQ